MSEINYIEAFYQMKPLIEGLYQVQAQQALSLLGDYAPSPHALGGSDHSGLILDAQAPQFLKADGSRTLTGNLAVGAGVTIDGIDLSTLADLVHTPRQIIAGAGLTGGGDLGADRTLDVGAGDGISVAADSVAVNATVVRTTRTISAAGTGLSGGGDLSANRTLTLDSSANPGEAQKVLLTSPAGLLTLYDLTLTHNLIAPNVASNLIPTATDTYDLGSSTKLWRKGWLSEMDAVLFAENTIAVIGGWMYICKGQGVLAADLPAEGGSHNYALPSGLSCAVNDFLVLRSSLQVEYMQVTAIVGGGVYTVTRALDGAGHLWPAGSVIVNLGYDGTGRIELNAYDTPRLSILKQGATYNAQTESVRIGDLNGLGGAGASAYGLFAGDANNYLRFDPTTTPNFVLKAGGGAVGIDGAGGIGIDLSTGLVAARSYHFNSANMAWLGLYAYETANEVVQHLTAVSNGKAKDITTALVAHAEDAYYGIVELSAESGGDATQFSLFFDHVANKGYAKFFTNFYGLVVGADATPGEMLDVRGNAVLTGSIKQSTALGARVYHNAAQATTSTVWTVLAMNNERFDTDACHDNATNNSRLTCKTAGKYVIGGTFVMDASAGGARRAIEVRLNGASILAMNFAPVAGAYAIAANVETVYDLAVNDYVELLAYQDSGGDLNVLSSSPYSPEFWMVRIA